MRSFAMLMMGAQSALLVHAIYRFATGQCELSEIVFIAANVVFCGWLTFIIFKRTA